MTALCCQSDSKENRLFPFTSNVHWGFYDGPLEGICSCLVCNRLFYYHCVCDEYTYENFETSWYCRVFLFSDLSLLPENIKETINNCLVAEKDTSTYNEVQIFWEYIQKVPVSHLCVSDAYIRNGYWRKIKTEDSTALNWYVYLGVEIDEDNGTFNVKNF